MAISVEEAICAKADKERNERKERVALIREEIDNIEIKIDEYLAEHNFWCSSVDKHILFRTKESFDIATEILKEKYEDKNWYVYYRNNEIYITQYPPKEEKKPTFREKLFGFIIYIIT